MFKANCHDCRVRYFGLFPSRWLAKHMRTQHLQCEGCGAPETSCVDADGYHLCRDCGDTLCR